MGIFYKEGEVDANGAQEVTVKNASGTELAINTDGSINTAVFQGFPTRTVYTTTIPTLFPAANATDVFILTGSATKLVRLLYLELFITQTVSAGTYSWFLWRRSTLDTGGTPAVLTPKVHDTTDPAATVVVREYLANPTLGTSVGITTRAQIYHSDGTVGNESSQPGYVFNFIQNGFDKGIVLRGVNEMIALNFNGAAVPAGLTVYGNMLHSEE